MKSREVLESAIHTSARIFLILGGMTLALVLILSLGSGASMAANNKNPGWGSVFFLTGCVEILAKVGPIAFASYASLGLLSIPTTFLYFRFFKKPLPPS